MDSFLRLYGFYRNVAFVTFLTGIGLTLKLAWHWQSNGWNSDTESMAAHLCLATFTAFGMIHRYLKFHRLFSVEVLTTFANSLNEEPIRA